MEITNPHIHTHHQSELWTCVLFYEYFWGWKIVRKWKEIQYTIEVVEDELDEWTLKCKYTSLQCLNINFTYK